MLGSFENTGQELMENPSSIPTTPSSGSNDALHSKRQKVSPVTKATSRADDSVAVTLTVAERKFLVLPLQRNDEFHVKVSLTPDVQELIDKHGVGSLWNYDNDGKVTLLDDNCKNILEHEGLHWLSSSEVNDAVQKLEEAQAKQSEFMKGLAVFRVDSVTCATDAASPWRILKGCLVDRESNRIPLMPHLAVKFLHGFPPEQQVEIGDRLVFFAFTITREVYSKGKTAVYYNIICPTKIDFKDIKRANVYYVVLKRENEEDAVIEDFTL